jgi:hypothetical protein
MIGDEVVVVPAVVPTQVDLPEMGVGHESFREVDGVLDLAIAIGDFGEGIGAMGEICDVIGAFGEMGM